MTARVQFAGHPASAQGAYVARLRSELTVLQKWGAEPQARAILHVIEELTTIERAADEELLTLRTAARTSGYSEDHLGRLIRSGALQNRGRKGSPRICRADLPTRPARLQDAARTTTIGRSKAAIARAITGPR